MDVPAKPVYDISIIIPAKNEEKYIETTLKQFMPYKDIYNLELIVSDGNSDDATAAIARPYATVVVPDADARPQTIAMGRNLGARHACGRLLMHMDADVILPDIPGFISAVLQTFENTNITAASVPIWVYPEEEHWTDVLYHALMNSAIYLANYIGSFLSKGECQIVRKDAFDAVRGYKESVVVGEDCNLFYRLRKKGKIAFLTGIKVYHSPRRFRKTGYFRYTVQCFREGIYLLLFKRSYLKIWNVIR